jgi:YD repeat-containing protein
MVEESTTSGETTKTIKSVYNTLAQLTEYTDAAGNTGQYVYAGPGSDSLLEEINYGGKKGSEIYAYNLTSMQLEKLLDIGPEGGAGAGTFAVASTAMGRHSYRGTSNVSPIYVLT